MGGLSRRFGVARRTIKRWLAYFMVVLPKQAVWRVARGFVGPQVRESDLPSSLVLWVSGGSALTQSGVISILKLLAGVS